MEGCSPGYFAHSPSRQCRRCSETCSECAGPGPGECLVCHGKALLLAGRCTLVCPPGHYHAPSYQCRPCHSSCQLCHGPGAHSCLSCPLASQLYNGTCQPHHPDPQPPLLSSASLVMLAVWLTAGASVSLLAYCMCGLLKHRNSGTPGCNKYGFYNSFFYYHIYFQCVSMCPTSPTRNFNNATVSYSRVRVGEEESEEENQFLIIDKI